MNEQTPTEREVALANFLLPSGITQSATERNKTLENILGLIVHWTRCEGKTAEEWRELKSKETDRLNWLLPRQYDHKTRQSIDDELVAAAHDEQTQRQDRTESSGPYGGNGKTA